MCDVGRKRKKGYTIVPWLSGREDCKEPHYIQVGVTLFEHPAFQALSPVQRYLYLCMTHDAEGRREFTFSKARFCKYGISNSAARDGINVLIKKGFIVRLYSGQATREKSGYAFSNQWKVKTYPFLSDG